MNIRSISISAKIFIAIFILIAGYLITTISFSINGSQAEKRLLNVSGDYFSAAQLSQHAVTSFDELLTAYQDAVLLGDEEYIQSAREYKEAVAARLSEIISLTEITSQSRKENKDILSLTQLFTVAAEPVYLQMSKGSDDGELLKQGVVLSEQANLIKERLDRSEQQFADELKAETRAIAQSLKSQRIRNIYIFIGVVTGVLLLSFFIIIKYLTTPLGNTVAMMRDIAEGEGDLTKRLHIASRDEIGNLSLWFNNFIQNIQSIISSVVHNSKQLEKASSVLTSTAAQLSSGAGELTRQAENASSLTHQIKEHVNNVNTTAETMSHKASSIAQSASQTSEHVTSAAAAVEEMNSTINEVARSCASAQQLADKGAVESASVKEEVESLNQAAQEIGTITEIISRITEQVNLLALNATIEAASAGEAGRGFAVVANEIKELARQTADATAGISSSIESIQEKTTGVLHSINKVSAATNDVNDITISIAAAVEEQSVTSAEISKMVSHAAHNVEEVSEDVEALTTSITGTIVTSIAEAAEQLGNVSESVQEMKKVAAETSSSVSDIDEASANLSLLASQLKGLVSKFKLK